MNSRHQQGFSLVELMVAMGLSLILMAGALSILYSSRITYNENDRLARLQEAGRAAMELLMRDARGVGYVGCSRQSANPTDTTFYNRLNTSNGLLWNFAQPIFGFQSTGGGWSPGIDPLIISPLAGSDVLVLRGARQGQAILRTTGPVAPDATIPVALAASAPVLTDQPYIISDCTGASAFVATAYAGTATAGTITHASGTANPSTPTNVDSSLQLTFQMFAQVIPVQTTIYYVRDSTSGLGPALWRQVGSAPAEPLIEGVENMQLLFGVDTDANLQVNNYVTADSVTNWNNVISVTIALLIRTEDQTGTEVDRKSYTMLGATTLGPFTDRRQRAVFLSTVTLRNVSS